MMFFTGSEPQGWAVMNDFSTGSGSHPPPRQRDDEVEWSYETAFSRNLGLVNPREQEKLRTSRVAIAGMGGIGGIDLVTLVRLGIERFSIADPDVFDPANTNRQFGAMRSTIGRPKAEVMAEIARDINPEIDIRVFSEPIGETNVEAFLDGADVFVDAVEVFATDARRLLFQRARSEGIYGVTAGPVGFSGIWIIFDPEGMSFDRYFDFRDEMDNLEKLVAFAVGVAPKATQRTYMNLQELDIAGRRGPSSSAACHLAAGAMGIEIVKILLQRGTIKPAPNYHQFDPYIGKYARGYALGGNRHPWQKLKRRILLNALRKKARE